MLQNSCSHESCETYLIYLFVVNKTYIAILFYNSILTYGNCRQTARPGTAATARLTACLVNIEAWLNASALRLNPIKTKVMWLGSRSCQKVDISEVPLVLTCIYVSEMARDLGVVIDNQLSLSAQVAAVCRSGYYQLRQLRPLVKKDHKD